MPKGDRVPERSYGLGDCEVIGIPTASDVEDAPDCPNCGCARIFHISVRATTPLVKGGVGQGSYFGCPACPWASPMLIASDGRGSDG